MAKQNPKKRIKFLAIGFETTAPSTAIAVINAFNEKLNNFFVFSAHKIMPPAMKALVDDGVKINGYIGPGHVSTIAGSTIFDDISEKYGLPIVITGFEPLDLLQSIYMLVKQIENKTPKVEIQYKRVVSKFGNMKALKIMNEVFTCRDDWWRGLGILKNSGLKISNKYLCFDAESKIAVNVEPTFEEKACICGLILKGAKKPSDCKLFGKKCTPDNPIGACMVSNEGACAAYFKYN